MQEYDEFGNLIGGDDSDSEQSEVQSVSDADNFNSESENANSGPENSAQLITQDDIKAVTLSQTFGPNVTTIVAQPQDINAPVITPAKEKTGKVEIDFKDSSLIYSLDYMVNTAFQVPDRIRNIAMVGHLHTGKTSFIDMLVSQTHNIKALKYMDNHTLEVQRAMSIKASPITLLLQDINERSYVFNIIDTPGHINFMDESIAALEAVDGAVLVIDAVEGLTFKDKLSLDEIITRNLQMSLVINKLDRLILDLRLPVSDAYYKLEYMIDEINEYILNHKFINNYKYDGVLSPTKENVTFASSSLNFSFTLTSFTQLYLSRNNLEVDLQAFARRLWGNNYYDLNKSKITKDSNRGSNPRTFMHFILEPLYKIFTYTMTRDSNLSLILEKEFGISLTKKQLVSDTRDLLPLILGTVFPVSSGFVNMVVHCIQPPTPTVNVPIVLSKSIPEDRLVAQVVKLIEATDGDSFYSLIRVHQGTMKKGDEIKVVSEAFNREQEILLSTIQELYIPGGRYKVPVNEVGEGFIVLVKGIESCFTSQAVILDGSIEPEIIRSVNFHDNCKDSVFKVAVEPKNPADLPRLVGSLKKINRSYLSADVRVEESGEHVLLATGEVSLDCILHDVRNFFEDQLEIRVSDPMVRFSETVTETSATKITSTIGDISVSVIAEPVNNDKLSKAIENHQIDLSAPLRQVSKLLRTEYNVESLESRRLWKVGPKDFQQPDILVNDTIEAETEVEKLQSIKQAFEIGFDWSCNEGPLCDEPIRNTKFRILDFKVDGESSITNAQIIPLARRACYTGFLTARPKLMEPIYKLYVTATFRANNFIEKIVSSRRGFIISNEPIPGTQLYRIEGKVPVIESFGLETEIRLQTQGQAMAYFKFDKYKISPGDPLDPDVYLPDLKPVPTESIARDFVMKTRRRKGLTGEPTLQKYIDQELYEKLKIVGFV